MYTPNKRQHISVLYTHTHVLLQARQWGKEESRIGQIDFGIRRHCFMTESASVPRKTRTWTWSIGKFSFYLLRRYYSVSSPNMTGNPDNCRKRGPGAILSTAIAVLRFFPTETKLDASI